jgi:hypothetical protein
METPRRNSLSGYGRSWLLAATWMAVAAGAAHAQVTVVSLGKVSGGVNSEVIVPVLLNPASTETRVGSISATIGFDSSLVAFLRGEKGFLLDGVNGAFRTELHENSAQPAESTVQLEVATEGEPRRALREGLVLSLIFKIKESAPAGTVTPLRIAKLAAATADSSPQPIEPLVPVSGSVEVLAPEAVPYISCFFFTH